MPTDATETAKKIAAARKDFLADLLGTFESPCGKRVIEWLRATTAADSPAFTPGGNPNDAIWRDGRKSIFLEIQATLKTARIEHGAEPKPDKPKATGRGASRRKVG
jgi:hypothetical protein